MRRGNSKREVFPELGKYSLCYSNCSPNTCKGARGRRGTADMATRNIPPPKQKVRELGVPVLYPVSDVQCCPIVHQKKIKLIFVTLCIQPPDKFIHFTLQHHYIIIIISSSIIITYITITINNFILQHLCVRKEAKTKLGWSFPNSSASKMRFLESGPLGLW